MCRSASKTSNCPNAQDLPQPGAEKIDITIVVDMLLTGFDSKYLNTLYVDKNLKHHGLIQAFSRTNRVLNDTKPYGNILDFRQQQDAVDAAIALFSGEKAADKAREIWLVDKAPVGHREAGNRRTEARHFMKSQGLDCAPEAVPNLKGDDARAAFIKHFKEVQRLKTQLDQYTDLTDENRKLPSSRSCRKKNLLRLPRRLSGNRPAPEGAAGQGPRSGRRQAEPGCRPTRFRVRPLRLGRHRLRLHHGADRPLLRRRRRQAEDEPRAADRPDPVRCQVHGRARGYRRYINTLKAGEGLSEKAIRDGYSRFKAEKNAAGAGGHRGKHGLATEALQGFVDTILQRMIFDGEQLTDLMEPLGLNWKARRVKELDLMADLMPLLIKRAGGREISGLSAYEQ